MTVDRVVLGAAAVVVVVVVVGLPLPPVLSVPLVSCAQGVFEPVSSTSVAARSMTSFPFGADSSESE
ncbi:hypothetical protein [Nocardia araoensis]|uniref:hypothetical protein n=1 Tax=Nocardia araoensis TaxID=228600 RepID=UPI0012F67897|nr:hypothetical protein [Nocardia araoensis]